MFNGYVISSTTIILCSVALQGEKCEAYRLHLKRVPFQICARALGDLQGVTIQDYANRKLVRYFGGLPYAETGTTRFCCCQPLTSGYQHGIRFTGSTSCCPQQTFYNEAPAETGEDCLQLNIHIPDEEKPPDGWPVFPKLTVVSCNMATPTKIQNFDSVFRAVVVIPAYRLNAFGFLASHELRDESGTIGNMGFWDQRLALNWTAKNIGSFGGDASKITVAVYSAGAHSTFYQLAHELYFVPDDDVLIKRPKTLDEHQKQFGELLAQLNIPSDQTPDNMQLCEFRAVSDDLFVRKDLMARINDGGSSARMKRRGVKIMNGECRDEHHLYQAWLIPASWYQAVANRLRADYPDGVVEKVIKQVDNNTNDWQACFGHLYANMQVHWLEHGFNNAFAKGGLEPGRDLLRHRIDWRATCVELPPEWGVTHTSDLAIWLWSDGLTNAEKDRLRPWNEALAKFVGGKKAEWDTHHAKQVKRLRANEMDVWLDDQWEEGVKMWKVLTAN
ncbi:alpha/beta-hydrolase [Piedraia hortae CBS 480.64]|uniref:Alpha/beta-hydrolase n=1 Tax=Piedraia hortae CBS 480.64 TaxID=1314780 RepID=A0A6A7C1E4_9PEZI|nr:alpha/beta-hydrolase [Piedraia hortae CBS 480.64]